MEAIFEKYSILDFFNLIGAGGVFFIGLSLINVSDNCRVDDVASAVSSITSVEPFKAAEDVIIAGFFIGICYIAGSVLQVLGGSIYKRIENAYISKFLNNESAIGNSVKFNIYREKAETVLKKKKVAVFQTDASGKIYFSENQCRYFFAYCIYYIQIRERHAKPERMRAVCSISGMLMICFIVLAVLGLKSAPMHSACFLGLAVLFAYRMWKSTLDRIRMIMGIYEVCSDSN